MLSAQSELPFPLSADAQVCADARCATVLSADAEMCDECGGARLERLGATGAVLCAWAGERPVAFRLSGGGPALIGRSTGADGIPDIDLSRFPTSQQVHRRHAELRPVDGGWQVTHLGTNPLVVHGARSVVVPPGTGTLLRPGDTLDVGGVRLHLVARSRSGDA